MARDEEEPTSILTLNVLCNAHPNSHQSTNQQERCFGQHYLFDPRFVQEVRQDAPVFEDGRVQPSRQNVLPGPVCHPNHISVPG